MAEPITPKQFKEAYGSGIPDVVIETVNELLLSKCRFEGQKRVCLKQNEVVDALVAKGIERNSIFDKKMLDFEPLFRSKGWKVEWNKGAYYETDASNWIFEFN